jgi:hypothetical protein
MNYAMRLADVCLAAYFVMSLGFDLTAHGFVRGAMLRAERMKPATGARVLLGLRFAPSVLAVLAVAAFCVPSYLRFEQDATESVGFICSLLALGGLVMLVVSAARLVWGLSVGGQRPQQHDGVERPVFALIGFIGPKVIVSSGIRKALSSTQMEAALLHEAAHSRSRDNLKRLALFAAPSPLGGWSTLETQWARLAEWAADDAAVGGEPRRALALAEALVCVAKLYGPEEDLLLASSLVARADDLGQRVQRILAQRQAVAVPQTTSRVLMAWAAVIAATCAIVGQKVDLLYLVHCAMERLVH